MCLYCEQISDMERKLSELRKGEVRTSDTQGSAVQRTQKAIQTLEYKLDRVSYEASFSSQ